MEGLLTETFAYTELNRLYQAPVRKKLVRGDKPCFSVCGDYELGFVELDKNDRRIGIEVKTGNNRARSLEVYKEKGMIDLGYRAALLRGGRGERFRIIPIYGVGARLPYEDRE